MPDYAKYRAALHLSNNDIISSVQKKHPGFTKIQCAMINNPGKYGVQLTSSAEQSLIDDYGHADGLSVRKRKGSGVKRIKTRRLAVRLDDQCYDMVKNKMHQEGFESAQSFLEDLLRKAVDSK